MRTRRVTGLKICSLTLSERFCCRLTLRNSASLCWNSTAAVTITVAALLCMKQIKRARALNTT